MNILDDILDLPIEVTLKGKKGDKGDKPIITYGGGRPDKRLIADMYIDKDNGDLWLNI